MNNVLIWQPVLPPVLSAPLGQRGRAMLYEQSLTLALKSLDGDFSVRLLHLGESTAGVWLKDCSDGLYTDKAGFARDVLLCLDDEPVVWARSFCLAQDVFWRQMLDCGTQPLGARLFDGSLPLYRTPFTYTSADPSDALPLYGHSGHAFAARRSAFTHQQSVLGLVECFLPALLRFL